MDSELRGHEVIWGPEIVHRFSVSGARAEIRWFRVPTGRHPDSSSVMERFRDGHRHSDARGPGGRIRRGSARDLPKLDSARLLRATPDL